MMAVRARRHTHDPGPRLQAVTSEPFLILAVTGSSRSGGVAACRRRETESPVDELADKTPCITTTRGFRAFLPCVAAALASDPELRGRDHRPPPDLDRPAAAEAEPRAAGPPGPGLPAQRRDVHQPRGRVQGRHGHCLAVRGGDGRAARRTRAEAAQGGPGRGEGRARLRRPGRDADPHRPGRRGPALLLRQAQEARHEPAGHRRPPKRHPLWVSRALPGSVHDKKAE